MAELANKPLYSALAHVFHIDPNTKKNWLPTSKQSVNVAFYYDSNKFLYKILCIDGSKVLINSTITSSMTFTKTSQKFGQWSDAKANTVYGLGFQSENEMTKFSEKFKECKNNVRSGTPPANRKDVTSVPSPAVNGVTGGSMKSMLSNSTGSIEDEAQSPGSHRSSSSSSESQMKYENDRLKKALAQSSSNAKKWEAEFQTLKNNNARLTAALQESAVNVEKWKEQLNSYKQENSKLRKKVATGGSTSGSDISSNSSVRDLEQKLHDCEVKLKRKEDEVNRLSQHGSEELHLLREKNAELSKKIQHLELEQKQRLHSIVDDKAKQLKFNDSKFKQINEVRSDMELKLCELNMLQQKMNSLCKP